MSILANLQGYALVAAFGLLSGCGVTYYDGGPSGNPPPTGGGGGDFSIFLIDPGAGVDVPDRAFGVTNNGARWTLAWVGDGTAHRFTGQVISGTRFDEVLFRGGFAGDKVQQTAAGQIDFDAKTDGKTVQQIDFTSASEPVRFDLDIDGQAAVFNVVFASQGVLSTSDEMPFELTTTPFARAGRTAPSALGRTDAGASAAPRTTHIQAPAPSR